jgi:hypothetical protein
VLLENFSYDWNGRVDGVGDDKDKSLGGCLSNASGELPNDASVDLE